MCPPGPADRLAGAGEVGRVGLLAGQQHTGAVGRAALITAPGQVAGPLSLTVPERDLRQCRQRKSHRRRVTGLLRECERRPAMRRSRRLLAEITECAGKESTGLGTNDIKVSRLPQPLLLPDFSAGPRASKARDLEITTEGSRFASGRGCCPASAKTRRLTCAARRTSGPGGELS